MNDIQFALGEIRVRLDSGAELKKQKKQIRKKETTKLSRDFDVSDGKSMKCLFPTGQQERRVLSILEMTTVILTFSVEYKNYEMI